MVAGNNNECLVDNNISVYGSVKIYVDGGMKVMDAIKLVASERGLPKGEVYSIYHKEKK